MSKNCNLTIKGADKSGKIVIINTKNYIEHCELLLNDIEFYEKLDAKPMLSYVEQSKQKIDDILKKNCITKQKYCYYAKNLENPQTPLFYRLPKIHKYIYFHYYGLLSLALIPTYAI